MLRRVLLARALSPSRLGSVEYQDLVVVWVKIAQPQEAKAPEGQPLSSLRAAEERDFGQIPAGRGGFRSRMRRKALVVDDTTVVFPPIRRPEPDTRHDQILILNRP